jgi:6,7-dimethyl-8-ribityllumazine synthase
MRVDKDNTSAADLPRKRAAEDGRPSILIIEGRFYDAINDELLRGAINALKKEGCGWEVITVPGALEIPVALAIAVDNDVIGMWSQHRGAVALGCVIRGETSHYDIVANDSAHGLMKLGMEYAIPVGNGILTTDTMEQATVRAAHDGYDKGGHAVRACLSLVGHQDDFEGRDDLDDEDDEE